LVVPDEKEIKYKDDSGQEVTEKVDAQTLDEEMNKAEAVYGVDGESKDKAAYLSQGPDDVPEEPVTGKRGG
jgi:hypothetical protein